MKKALITLVLVGLGFSAYAYYSMRTVEFIPEVTIITASRGVIADTVGATGTLEAVTTVQVGSQVSGIIQNLSADFNSIVRKGEVIARLDPVSVPDPDRAGSGQPGARTGRCRAPTRVRRRCEDQSRSGGGTGRKEPDSPDRARSGASGGPLGRSPDQVVGSASDTG